MCSLASTEATCLCAAQFGLAMGLFGQVDRVLIGAHFVVSTSSLLALDLVANWVSDIRQKISRQARPLEETLAQVQSMATTDMLTGLLNHRQMEQVLEAEMGLAQRQGHELCVAMIDLDHFKRVNDVHGHRMGDDVLVAFARLAQEALREQALAQGHPDLRITFSAGLATHVASASLGHTLERADAALYEAKRQGRDQVVRVDALTSGVPAAQHNTTFTARPPSEVSL